MSESDTRHSSSSALSTDLADHIQLRHIMCRLSRPFPCSAISPFWSDRHPLTCSSLRTTLAFEADETILLAQLYRADTPPAVSAQVSIADQNRANNLPSSLSVIYLRGTVISIPNQIMTSVRPHTPRYTTCPEGESRQQNHHSLNLRHTL